MTRMGRSSAAWQTIAGWPPARCSASSGRAGREIGTDDDLVYGVSLKIAINWRSPGNVRFSPEKRRRSGRQRWSTFLRNHSPHIAAMDLFVVPTIGFTLLYVLVIVRLARRELVWINVTAHPTAEW